MAIESIGGATGLAPPEQLRPAREARDDFAGQVESAIGKVDALQAGADDALRELAAGKDVNLHETMLALEKADISLRTLVSVRDKVVSAYENIMNMAI